MVNVEKIHKDISDDGGKKLTILNYGGWGACSSEECGTKTSCGTNPPLTVSAQGTCGYSYCFPNSYCNYDISKNGFDSLRKGIYTNTRQIAAVKGSPAPKLSNMQENFPDFASDAPNVVWSADIINKPVKPENYIGPPPFTNPGLPTADDIMTVANAYNGISIDIEGVVEGQGESDAFGKTLFDKISSWRKVLNSNGKEDFIIILTIPAFGVGVFDKSTSLLSETPSNTIMLGGDEPKNMDWFEHFIDPKTGDLKEGIVDYVCLMMYALINDTQTNAGAGSPDNALSQFKNRWRNPNTVPKTIHTMYLQRVLYSDFHSLQTLRSDRQSGQPPI